MPDSKSFKDTSLGGLLVRASRNSRSQILVFLDNGKAMVTILSLTPAKTRKLIEILQEAVEDSGSSLE